jgi:hypothetical protein
VPLFFQKSVVCLHPKFRVDDPALEAMVQALSFDYPTAPRGFYCVYDINELNDPVKDGEKGVSGIGSADFFFFDFLLLMVIPTNSSITIITCIAFGSIICVQLADSCTGLMLRYIDRSNGLPALPLPTIAITGYAIAINAIIEYLDVSCDDPLK